MIRITDHISIHEQDLAFSFIRSPGPGGQNVNKVASAVQLRFDAKAAANINAAMFARLARLAGSRMTRDGVIVITAHQHRTQAMNKEDAINRLVALLKEAAVQPRRRVATKPSRAAKERRLQSKRKASNIKKARGRVSPTD